MPTYVLTHPEIQTPLVVVRFVSKLNPIGLAMSRHPVRILHVDDDPAMTRLTAQLLRAHGIEITPLHDPTKAVDRIAAENFRIVIVDLQMPKIDGFELLERIKRADGGTAVIMLTGVVSQTSLIRSLHQGATACFFKPLTDVEGLVDCIRDIDKSFQRWRSALKQLTQLRKLEHSWRDNLSGVDSVRHCPQ